MVFPSKSARSLSVVGTPTIRATVIINLSAARKDPAVAALDVAFIAIVTTQPLLLLQFPGPLHQTLHG